MTLKLTKWLRRFALACLISAVSSTGTCLSEDTISIQETAANSSVTQEIQNSESNEETWIESHTCNFDPENEEYVAFLGTHDSIRVGMIPAANVPKKQPEKSTAVESSLAAFATTACAKMGISVEQIVEPFVMVGPTETNSIEAVARFQDWWKVATKTAIEAEKYPQSALASIAPVVDDDETTNEPTEAADANTAASEVSSNDDAEFDLVGIVPIVDFDSELFGESWSPLLASASTSETDSESNSLSTMGIDHVVEIDIQQWLNPESVDNAPLVTIDDDRLVALGQSVLVSPIEVADEIPAGASLVGSSAVIATIEEVYVPHDFSVRDLYAGKPYSSARRPFCVRDRGVFDAISIDGFDTVDVLAFGDEPIDTLVDRSEPDPMKLVDAQAKKDQELLQEFVGRADVVLKKGRPLRDWLRPQKHGETIAEFVVSSNRVASMLAAGLERVWRDAPPKPPSPAGAQLLARAVALPNAELDAEQADEALAQLIGTVQQVAETAQKRWADFTDDTQEIAATDAPTRR